MAQTKRTAKLDSPTARLKLEAQKDHVWTSSPGHYLYYRRPISGNGTWRAKWRHLESGKILSEPLGPADDYSESDGIAILSFDQACKKAGEWFVLCEEKAVLEAKGILSSKKNFRISDAIEHYRLYAEREGCSLVPIDGFNKTSIQPFIGDLEVEGLTWQRLQKWMVDLANTPPRKTGQGVSEMRQDWNPTEEQLRSRKVTANRVLGILKSALNQATRDGLYTGPECWHRVQKFKSVKKSRVRFLSKKEKMALINSCRPEFRDLVIAALYTGSRYAPLTRLLVKDFNEESGTIWIEEDKGKPGQETSRYVHLSPDAIDWFKTVIEGKAPNELIFQRKEVVRKKRGGNGWLPYDQTWEMKLAYEAADIEPLTFHELRHTYASELVNAGVPLAFVAAQLGHSNTKMVEEYYGHRSDSAIKEAIRTRSPKMALANSNIVKLA